MDFFAQCSRPQFTAYHIDIAALLNGRDSLGISGWPPDAVLLQSFDQQGSFHPAPDALDFSPLETLFRERVFKVLLKNEATTEDRVALVGSLRVPRR